MPDYAQKTRTRESLPRPVSILSAFPPSLRGAPKAADHQAPPAALNSNPGIRAIAQQRHIAPADLLWLQQLVGNRATSRLLRSRDRAIHRSHRVPPSGAILQRAVGFEFESTWDLKKPADTAWNTDSPLVQGDQWKMSPDEIGEVANQGKIEFKTQPLEVDTENEETMLNAAQPVFTSLKHYGDILATLTGETALPQAEAGFREVKVTPKGSLTAKPQVTGGVRPDLLIKLLNDATRKGKDQDLMPHEWAKGALTSSVTHAREKMDEDSKESREYWGSVSLIGFIIRTSHDRFNRAKEKVDGMREAVKVRVKSIHEDETKNQEAKERELAELKIRYESAKQRVVEEFRPSYGKSVAGILPRVRFRKLPGITKPTVLKDILESAGMTEADKTKKIFPLGLDVAPDHEETIEDWITRIQAENENAELKHAAFWSEREFTSGEVGRGAQKGPGLLFEMRGIGGGLGYAEWWAFAQWYLRYFRKVNEAAKPANP